LPEGAPQQRGLSLLVERLLPEFPTSSEEDREQALTDLVMLSGPGSMERREKQYRRLVGEGGFGKSVIYPAGLFSVIDDELIRRVGRPLLAREACRNGL
jgi:hypothetical protein